MDRQTDWHWWLQRLVLLTFPVYFLQLHIICLLTATLSFIYGYNNHNNKIMAKPCEYITRQVLMGETIHKIKGLATECRKLCLSLGLPSIIAQELSKSEIKQAINTRIQEECIKRMQDGSKSQDRIDLNSDEIQYFQRLSLTNCRVYFRYRSRSTAMVKSLRDEVWDWVM